MPYSLFAAPPLDKNDLNNVLPRVWPARSKWYLIGCLLGIDIVTLEAIKRDNRNQSDDCFTRMLSTWLHGDTTLATWKSLVDVLQSPVVGVRVIMTPESKGQFLRMYVVHCVTYDKYEVYYILILLLL